MLHDERSGNFTDRTGAGTVVSVVPVPVPVPVPLPAAGRSVHGRWDATPSLRPIPELCDDATRLLRTARLQGSARGAERRIVVRHNPCQAQRTGGSWRLGST